MSNGKIVSEDAGLEGRLEGCLCEYIREDYRERLERVIERGGGGVPGSNTNFANVLIHVNRALEKYLDNLGTARPARSGARSKVKAKPRSVLAK
jgi:hypothetical protein